jgi:hypothetical protein
VSVTVRNDGWRVISLSGGQNLPPGERCVVDSVAAPNEQGWLQSGDLKVVSA